MIFSKTFNSELYSQIVCMMDREEGFCDYNPCITFYFYVDGSVHSFSFTFGNTDLGLNLRQQCFDNLLNADDVQQLIFDKLAEGKQ